MKRQALYNKGNALFRTGDVNKAIKAYQRALEIDPKDVDTKFNLEYARLQQKRAQQSGRMKPNDSGQKQEPKPGGLNQSPPQKQTGEGKPEQSEQADASEHPKEKDEQESDSENSDSQPADNQTPAPHPSPSKADEQKVAQAMKEITSMNKAEADRWLNSLNEDLRKINRRQMQGQMKDLFVEDGKDW